MRKETITQNCKLGIAIRFGDSAVNTEPLRIPDFVGSVRRCKLYLSSRVSCNNGAPVASWRLFRNGRPIVAIDEQAPADVNTALDYLLEALEERGEVSLDLE